MTNLHELIKSNRRAITKETGIPESTIRGWNDRQSIPQQYWHTLVEFQLATWDDLKEWAKPRREAAHD